jgi:hypothetical protein
MIPLYKFFVDPLILFGDKYNTKQFFAAKNVFKEI